jgi:PAS domain S-box-containing protein
MTTQPTAIILVVDDNEASLYTKSRFLRKAGFAVIEARTGSEGLHLAETMLPSLVLLDVNLPDINGLEVCRRIKSNPALASLFVLQISASLIRTEDKVRALEGGADSYLLEPVEPEELIATVRALLRLQRAEQALRESEMRFRNMADHAPVMIWITEANAQCTYLNQQWYEFTGQTPETALGFGWLNALHADDAPLVEQTFLQANQQRAPFRMEYRLRRHDGVYRWAIAAAAPRFGTTGEHLGYIGSVIDITERKQAEERLQTIYQMSEAVNRAEAVEQIYQQAFIALKRVLFVDRASILLFDEDGVMRFQAWHGLSTAYRQQAEGHSPWTMDESQPQPILVPDVAQLDLGELGQVIREEGIRALAFIPLIEGGRLLGKFMLYYDQPHPFGEAEVQWAQTIARHVAHALQRKQAEENLRRWNETLEQQVQERTAELQRSNRELDEFAYIASHDLKSPLRAIAHLVTWITEDAADLLPPPSQEHLAKLHSRAQRMEALLDDLLAYSRAGRQRHPIEPVKVAALVQNVTELLPIPAGFAVHVSPTLPLLNTERVPLETVLRNLIDNAIKHHHCPSEGWVEITMQDQAQWVEFTVRDNGPGIEPVFHRRIFEMFRTLQPRDRIEGSGVGLAVVKKLVESYGGRIHVESGLGQGATFRFTWPKGDGRSVSDRTV